MKRRGFIKKATAATAGAFMAPYILPSGRLFAATGARVVDHVVFCLFAGGVRNLESVHKADGNLMPNTLVGNESISTDIASGVQSLGQVGTTRLQEMGTLYKEFRFAQGPTGHFSGHSSVMTGVYNLNDINIRQRPQTPTVFEYYRKHSDPAANALNAWWVSNALGPYPALNYSSHPEYGALYGANYIQPASIISNAGYQALGNPKTFTQNQNNLVGQMRGFFDNNFESQTIAGSAGISNAKSDIPEVQQFLLDSLQEAAGGQYENPWGLGGMSPDMFNIFFAEKVIQRFQPELLVVNMQDVDVCHGNFTSYANNLMRADYALAHLWQTIQSTAGMANNTIMIALPEHGRNLLPNTVIDPYGRYALDHTNDDMSREIFCLVVGPNGKVVQNQVISQVQGQSIDVVPTIAKILGFYDDVSGFLPGQPLNAALA
ncbi:MAG: hypothetical protein K9J17_06055 [Flavobacteriales bacterium]|nr:hypothetical protein [Flavobacteriales bacterium]